MPWPLEAHDDDEDPGRKPTMDARPSYCHQPPLHSPQQPLLADVAKPQSCRHRDRTFPLNWCCAPRSLCACQWADAPQRNALHASIIDMLLRHMFGSGIMPQPRSQWTTLHSINRDNCAWLAKVPSASQAAGSDACPTLLYTSMTVELRCSRLSAWEYHQCREARSERRAGAIQAA